MYADASPSARYSAARAPARANANAAELACASAPRPAAGSPGAASFRPAGGGDDSDGAVPAYADALGKRTRALAAADAVHTTPLRPFARAQLERCAASLGAAAWGVRLAKVEGCLVEPLR